MKQGIIILFLFVAAACGGPSKQQTADDTTTSGTITVSCDESLRPIMEAEKEVFESLYPNAHINMVFMNEFDAIQYMLHDSARLALVTRQLTDEETKVLQEQQISHARYHKLGYDAVAFIMNDQNKDTSFSLEQVKDLLSGKIHNWSQIGSNSSLGEIQVVFDSPRSGAVRFLEDSVLKGSQLGKNSYALKSNPEVLEYVKKNKNALGIIGVSWISDLDDSQSRYFLDGIKVAEVQPVIMRVAGITNKPIQGNIALKQYPYWRMMQVVSREMRTGLGTGFASFMESEPGQKIILKGGLVPYRSSIRTVTIN